MFIFVMLVTCIPILIPKADLLCLQLNICSCIKMSYPLIFAYLSYIIKISLFMINI